MVNMATIDMPWKTLVPSKIHVLGWRAIRDRLPTREKLAKRGILTKDIDKVCVFCSLMVESLNRLMVGCPLSRVVWQKVARWVGMLLENFSDMVDHMISFYSEMEGMVGKRKRMLVWLATC
ncbi:unnamed protein product [Vicia faba]|uniref:Reverse transcriptase zinc-binding domain-containing protein n=1 Tax=Vicia faba TaxID=3906 RepID=A0AAV0Z2X0_VICFA|nr:unnamed protein product [Vicia faba]